MNRCETCGRFTVNLGGDSHSNTEHDYACMACEVVTTVTVNSISGAEIGRTRRSLTDKDRAIIEEIRKDPYKIR